LRMSERNTSTHQRMTGTVAADGSGLTYADWITDFDSTKVGLDAYVNGRFNVGGLRNEVTVGASYWKYTSDDMFVRTFTPGGNIFAIDHNRPEPTVASLLANGGRQTFSTYDVQQKGLYASLRTRLTEPLTAIVGARASWYDSLYTESAFNTQSTSSASGRDHALCRPGLRAHAAVVGLWQLHRRVRTAVAPHGDGRRARSGHRDELRAGHQG